MVIVVVDLIWGRVGIIAFVDLNMADYFIV